MADRVGGKVAVVTGGGSGIGRATAKLLASEGASVVITDVQQTGEDAAREMRAAGLKAHFIRADVTNETDWEAAINETMRVFGVPHVLVNNAGISGRSFSDWDSIEGWERIMNINAKGAYLGTRAVAKRMVAAGHPGSIINVSSIMGLVGSAGSHPAYHSSKGAIRLLTKATACQYGEHSIRANSVHPGYMPPMDTQGQAGTVSPGWKRAIEFTPLGRTGRLEEAAYCILFLASDESSFVTGSELVVDGGYTAR